MDISMDAYIDRLKKRIQEKNPESLLYGALELRSAVEGRMKYYLSPLEHIPKTQKNEWSVVKLGKSLNKAFQMNDHLALITIYLSNEGEHFTLRYVPVSTRLQSIANRLGDWLHFPGNRADDLDWWKELLQLLQEGLAWLEYANSSDLCGLPLLNSKTKQTSLAAVLRAGDPRIEQVNRLIQGGGHTIQVDYQPISINVPATAP